MSDHEYKPSRRARLAQDVTVGDLVYTAPAGADVAPAQRYDARRGETPGFAELRADLRARGLDLEVAGPFYWKAVPA